MAGLNRVSFSSDKTRATIEGGTLVNDMIIAAYNNDTRFANPTCTCLGFLGYALGGGINREMGLYGMGVDQLISAKAVTASGESLLVDDLNHPDLWYAIRGAAPNFAIVTSAVVKAYPTLKANNIAWEGSLTFPDEKLEVLMQTIQDLDLEPEMEIDFLFSSQGISAIPFYLGNTTAAKQAFAPILKLGPSSNTATEVPYSHWGDFANTFCMKGGRKPAYGASISRQGLNPKTWRLIYEEFKNFTTTYPQAVNSSILAEYYPVQKAISLGSAISSYPFRDIPIHVVTIPQYSDSSLDVVANAFGARTRDLMYSTDGLRRNSTYINFAHGDELLATVYGDDLTRLQTLKKRFDPQNRFDQWFPLT
ncbi:MAG: hypothetical protein Q9219_007565 [cf. Caloplaca sp. 3 TL-2023]